ncbi:hypothetical protein SAMN04490220_9166 [Rhodococcus jostii]|uniref:HicB family protein n=1 Tax=Rhodococcus jostii TaxID=132919 RepID=A0A1H5MNI2_RHOJO|nr:hypothetical protein SAMN04490220_9166 [Rhodococcus jostii]
MADPSHYIYRVTWSESDSEFVGTVAEFSSVSWLAETQNEALDGIVTVVREVLGDMASTGERRPCRSRTAPTAAPSPCGPHRGCTALWRSRPRSRVSH